MSAPATLTACPDCGGRQWRRQIGASACACLVRDVREQAAAFHGLADRMTVHTLESEMELGALRDCVAELISRLEILEGRTHDI